MKIKNINELKKSINRSSIFGFIIILSLVLTVLYLTHNKFIYKKSLLNRQEIASAINAYKSNLSEKLSIIASSTVFIDYLNSGEKTRNNLYTQFLSQIYSLKSKSISGMKITDDSGNEIFHHGTTTSSFISINLCYLNQSLDSNMGDCRFLWTLYLNKDELSKELIFLNNSIKVCEKCTPYNLMNNAEFGSFMIKNQSNMNLPIKIFDKNDYFFYIYFFLMILALGLFGFWSWHRLNSILNNYIADPIKNLTSCLKINEHLEIKDNIEEIQFLINEINTWKSKLNKIQSDKRTEIIGKIAAQLAHDVRSPLSAINMLVKNLTNVPENYRVTLLKASQRISDISNNFLSQYKKPLENSDKSAISSEHIPSILEYMVSEKRSQYIDRDIDIKLLINNDAWNIFSKVNSTEFKRIISNLVNNSIEAINNSGYVHLTLAKINNNLLIEIIDNGHGIPSDLIPKIIKNGISIGKEHGLGLGLSHAIKKIKEWHGGLFIESDTNSGTKINIKLPLENNVPNWFKSSLTLTNFTTVCILDDEPYTHEAWQIKIKNSHSKQLSIKHFYTQYELCKFIQSNPTLEVTFLIDYDLGSVSNGIDLITSLDINNKAILVTNRYDDIEIQHQCLSFGIKIIPKNLIPYIPLNIDNSPTT